MSETTSLRSAPLPVKIAIACAWLLAWPMIWDGLAMRILGVYPAWAGGLAAWVPLAEAWQLDPHTWGWLWLVTGPTLLAGSFGMSWGRRWGHSACVVASAAGLAYLGPGAALAALCLGLLALPAVRAYASE